MSRSSRGRCRSSDPRSRSGVPGRPTAETIGVVAYPCATGVVWLVRTGVVARSWEFVASTGVPGRSGVSNRDIVVIGASAGGVEALRAVVQGLAPDLPAAVLMVLHVPPSSPSALPAILGRAT